MGSIVTAKCECGLDTKILVGAGMEGFGTYCLFPCACEGCHSVVQVNLAEERLLCPKCGCVDVIPFDDSRLSARAERISEEVSGPPAVEEGSKPTPRTIVSWDVPGQPRKIVNLYEENYRCPQCGNMSLRFEEVGLFD